MSAKDRVALTLVPHLVIDGALLAARAIGAREAVVAAPADVLGEVSAALRDRRRQGDPNVKWRLVESPPSYVGGEETALIAHIEGRPALPRTKPPLPVERGLDGRPTLVQNVETLAQLALIARYGPGWFRTEGTAAHPGTMLVTLSGAVEQPGVYEVALGTPLPSLVTLAGGPLEPIRALLVGGYFGAWVDGDGDGFTLDSESLRRAGTGVGAGVIVALGASACPVAETARLATWLSRASAGQCGSCVHGLASLAGVLDRFATARTNPGDGERLVRWTRMVEGRGACSHPSGAARMIASATRVFSLELTDHARRGHSRACMVEETLRTPAYDARAA